METIIRPRQGSKGPRRLGERVNREDCYLSKRALPGKAASGGITQEGNIETVDPEPEGGLRYSSNVNHLQPLSTVGVKASWRKSEPHLAPLPISFRPSYSISCIMDSVPLTLNDSV